MPASGRSLDGLTANKRNKQLTNASTPTGKTLTWFWQRRFSTWVTHLVEQEVNPFMRVPIFFTLLVAGMGILSGCGSIQPSLPAKSPDNSSQSLTASQKADLIWNDKIIPTIYSDLPALTAPGVLDLFKFAQTSFTIRALTNNSDELDLGHRKLVHAWGAEARFRFVSSKRASGYTGIYESGSDCVIGRLSMATKPTKTTSVPALALKFLSPVTTRLIYWF